ATPEQPANPSESSTIGRRMLTLDFTPQSRNDLPSTSVRPGEIYLETESATNLRYGYFNYPITFEADGKQILHHATAPLIDFMFCLAFSIEEIHSTGKSDIDFTENSYVIQLHRNGETLRITAPRKGIEAECLAEEYFKAAVDLIGKGVAHITAHYPAMAQNPTIENLREVAKI
ncbi:hypothetical protein ACFU99_36985, partial [Streptomyces sp. NPDC057654]|uniref:hypothetical protein n=1 Tax=Streptomyces sp. NPDC057654 TaxID=3346196 RepID=UPI00369D3A9C